MSDQVYETETRLKSYLDTNQQGRERMCLQILALDKNYSDIHPRHPKGGKDQGRDIEATYKDDVLCFCGVGFVNGACDSIEQKREINKKFLSDLNNAIEHARSEKLDLKGFVFFTNIELTVGERELLINEAKKAGLVRCEIYHRERMSIALNSPEGYAIRFNFLNIHLTEAEQASFFSKWGDDIQSVISNGFLEQKTAIDRMIFLQESRLPINYLSVGYKLKREYKSEEIEHFRIVSEFVFVDALDFEDNKYVMGLNLFRADNPNRYRKEKEATTPGFKYGLSGCTTLRLVNETGTLNEREFMINSSSSMGYEKLNYIGMDYANGELVRFPPVIRINNLDKSHFIPMISENLCDKIDSIEVYANGYILAKFFSKDLTFRDINEETLKDFPANLSEEESKIKWKFVEDINGCIFQFDFIGNTPKRIIGF